LNRLSEGGCPSSAVLDATRLSHGKAAHIVGLWRLDEGVRHDHVLLLRRALHWEHILNWVACRVWLGLLVAAGEGSGGGVSRAGLTAGRRASSVAAVRGISGQTISLVHVVVVLSTSTTTLLNASLGSALDRGCTLRKAAFDVSQHTHASI
jgi:hypothetical protein